SLPPPTSKQPSPPASRCSSPPSAAPAGAAEKIAAQEKVLWAKIDAALGAYVKAVREINRGGEVETGDIVERIAEGLRSPEARGE
ncbi:hypothetical protein TeGR_g4654, partial [Tetraparma gracilis]